MFDWRTKTDQWIIDFIVKMQGQMETRRELYEPMYEQAIKLFQPRRYDLQQSLEKHRRHQKGDRYGVCIYDPQPSRSLSKFSTGMVGSMVSRGDNDPWWIKFVAPRQELNEVDEVKEALQNAEDQVKFGFNQSTFYRELPQFYSDAGCTYAVMTAQVDKVNDRVIFLTRHPSGYWFTVDSLGQITADHFKIEMTAYDIVKEFGRKDVPQTIVDEAEGEKPNPFRKYEVLHAVYQNESRREGSLDSTDKPFIQFYIVLNAGRGGKGHALINKDGVDWRPITLRIGACLTEDYPLSLALDALTQGSYGNALSRDQLRLSQQAANPARRISNTLRSQIHRNKLNAGSNTYVDNPEEIIEFLNNQGNWPVSEEQIRKIGGYIDEVFFIPFFQAASSGQEGPQRTAFEVSQIVSESIQMMGPVIEASEDDVLEPASSIIWAYETQAGRMPEMPEELFTEGRVQNRYMGRLAQLRRSIHTANDSVEQLELLERFGSLFPGSLAKIKDRVFIEKALIARGADQDIFRTDEEMEQIDLADAQRAQAEQEMQIAETMGKVLPPGKAIEENSPAAIAAT